MRVVFVTTHEAGTSVGGVEQHVANLSAALVRRGVDVWVLVPGFGRVRAARNQREPVTDCRGWRNYRCPSLMSRWMARYSSPERGQSTIKKASEIAFV